MDPNLLEPLPNECPAVTKGKADTVNYIVFNSILTTLSAGISSVLSKNLHVSKSIDVKRF